MGLGPHVGGTAGGGRDLVFVSYSRDDEVWLQRLEVLLKPLMRSKRLRLWVDTDIRGGDEWHPDIIRAIEQSSVALLLVSADFLNSDYIMEQELPALIEQGVRLAPVLVGECLWNQIPELKQVQWLHDPGRDGALNLVTDQPGQRDGRLRKICDRLITLIPDRRGDVVTGPPPVLVDAWRVAAVHAKPGLGELHGVPALPPGYLAREDLAAVIDAVVAVEGGAVGLIGEVAAVGLHGQGGIGKSVLAAAVAHDEGIRRQFPDGVYWVTLGDKADVLTVQLDLLARLGVRDRTPRTPAEALNHLCEVLENQRALLVVDDVWSAAAALAFRATGPRGRVLYTSRDPQVLAAAGARLHPVGVLSPAVARALAAAILDVTPGELPAAADRAFTDVGHVALAVALLAAAVRGGRSWDAVAADLRRDAGVFGDHPYANTFKAMQIAVTALPAELSDALVSLAVFPPDIQIPVVAITRYWAHTRELTAEQTVRDLDALAAANVLRLDEGVVGFHDLQHDYLLLHAPTLTLLHAGLLEAYRALLPADGHDQWWRLPVDEPYIGDHLITHLRGAGVHRELAATVTDPAYLAQRITVGGPRAAETDLSRAALALPTRDLIAWWQGWIARHADLLARDDHAEDDNSTHAAAVAPTMLAWLTAGGSLPEGVNPDRLLPLLPDPHLRVRWGLTPPTTTLIRVLTGHTNRVRALAWSPDGTRLVSAGDDGRARVWDPATGHQLATLAGHTGRVFAVVWSPDGTRLASAGDGQVRVWVSDPATGHYLATLSGPATSLVGHTGGVFAAAWSPDGTRLATAGTDREVRVWDLSSGHQLATLTGHTGRVSDVLVGRLGGPTRAKLAAILVGHTAKLFAVAWSPDGTRLASTGIDGRVRVWDAASGQQLATLTGFMLAVAWSPDGTRLAIAGFDGQVRLWDLPTGRRRSWRRSSSRQLATLTGHIGGVYAVAWSPDGTRLVSTGTDGRVRVWNSATGQQLATLTGHTSGVFAVAWSPDGTRLASASDDGQVRVWDPATGHQPATALTGHSDEAFAVAWSPDGTRLATAGTDLKVRLWNPASGHQLATLTGHPTIFDVFSGVAGYTGIVLAVAWSPDGTRLVSAAIDGRVRVWDAASGQQLATLTGHTRYVFAVAWSPDGTRLASAGGDGQVRLWDPPTGRRRSWRRSSSRHLFTLTGHTGDVLTVTWSPDGTQLATAGTDGRVRVWDPATGQQLATLTGHTGTVFAVAWSPDGTQLATAGNDQKVRLWNPASGHPLATLTGHTGTVYGVAWSPDGTRLATTSHGGKIYVFHLDCPDRLTYLRVEQLNRLQWTDAGIAVGGLPSVAVVDFICAWPQT